MSIFLLSTLILIPATRHDSWKHRRAYSYWGLYVGISGERSAAMAHSPFFPSHLGAFLPSAASATSKEATEYNAQTIRSETISRIPLVTGYI